MLTGVVHVLLAGVGEAAAGHLRRALHQMSRQRADGEPRVIVVAPVEPVQHRGQEQRRIGDAAGHHDRRAGRERVANHVGAEIRIGRRHARQQRLDRLAAFHERQLRIRAHDLGDVVAGHDRTGMSPRPSALRFFAHHARGAERVRGAHVGDDAHAVAHGTPAAPPESARPGTACSRAPGSSAA